MPFTVLFRSLPDFIVTKNDLGMRQESNSRGLAFVRFLFYKNCGFAA